MRLTYICIKFNKTSQLLAATYGRPLPHWRAELARRQGRGAGQGWAHSLRSPAHVASMLIIHVYKIYIIYAAMRRPTAGAGTASPSVGPRRPLRPQSMNHRYGPPLSPWEGHFPRPKQAINICTYKYICMNNMLTITYYRIYIF